MEWLSFNQRRAWLDAGAFALYDFYPVLNVKELVISPT